jgi:transposase-like protein
MSRRYTTAEKQHALESLDANAGDIHPTSTQLGISAQTLRNWQRKHQEQQTQREAELAHRLRHKLLKSAERLVDSLEAVIDNAPLNQRASALGAVIDRYLKLEAQLPEDDNQEQVIRIEYRYPDNSIHATPPWAGEDSEDETTLPSRSLWETFRQDGDGEDAHYRNGAERRPVLVARPDLSDGESGLAGFEEPLADEHPRTND